MKFTDDVLKRGDKCYCLIRPVENQQLMLPARGYVLNVILSPHMTMYHIGVNWVFETMYNVRKSVMGTTWKMLSDNPARMLFTDADLSSIEAFNTALVDRKYEFRVEYPFVFIFKDEMMDYYTKLLDFFIYSQIRSIRDLSTRNAYSGKFRTSNKEEFDNRLWQGFADKFSNRAEFDKWVEQMKGRDHTKYNALLG